MPIDDVEALVSHQAGISVCLQDAQQVETYTLGASRAVLFDCLDCDGALHALFALLVWPTQDHDVAQLAYLAEVDKFASISGGGAIMIVRFDAGMRSQVTRGDLYRRRDLFTRAALTDAAERLGLGGSYAALPIEPPVQPEPPAPSIREPTLSTQGKVAAGAAVAGGGALGIHLWFHLAAGAVHISRAATSLNSTPDYNPAASQAVRDPVPIAADAPLASSSAPFPARIIVDADNVYWIDPRAGGVCCKRKETSDDPIVLAQPNNPTGIASDDTNVYVSFDRTSRLMDGGVMRVPKSGGKAELMMNWFPHHAQPVIAAGQVCALVSTWNANGLYHDISCADGEADLLKNKGVAGMRTQNVAMALLGEGNFVELDRLAPLMAAEGNTLYLVDMKSPRILSIPAQGGGGVNTVLRLAEEPDQFATDSGVAFLATSKGGIEAIELGGEQRKVFVASTTSLVLQLAVSSSSVYWTERKGETADLFKAGRPPRSALLGGPEPDAGRGRPSARLPPRQVPERIASDLPLWTGIATDGMRVYWVSQAGVQFVVDKIVNRTPGKKAGGMAGKDTGRR